MNWSRLYEIAYIIVVVLVCIRIIWDTRSHTKTLAYLLLTIFVPVIGIIIYFSFGINYRKHKLYSKKLIEDIELAKKVQEEVTQSSKQVFEKNAAMVGSYRELTRLLVIDNLSALTSGNEVKLLINGEQKFPEVLQALKEAKHHIHIEYYIFEDGETARAIENIMIAKAREGVEVRFIYDDFGSRSVRKNLVKRLKNAGVKVFPFYKIIFMALANRLNYRNHRKIIVIDGKLGFVGGINVSDRYVNNHPNKLFWRDTHVLIHGPGVHYLQYIFLCDWNFCAGDHLQPSEKFFPPDNEFHSNGNKLVQIAASGPDSDSPTILYSLLQAINLAEKEILITTPYFIPGESVLDALITAALGGVSVKLLVPGVSDSVLVNSAAHSYYDELLKAGVEIYLYQKGFVHAKTMVADRKLAVVGTANMDSRSFDLNFEVNAIIYDRDLADELAKVFERDIIDAEKIVTEVWLNRSIYKQVLEKAARLVSPLL
jgi:cardiolipin synthase A/B